VEWIGQLHAPVALFPTQEPPPPHNHWVRDWLGPERKWRNQNLSFRSCVRVIG